MVCIVNSVFPQKLNFFQNQINGEYRSCTNDLNNFLCIFAETELLLQTTIAVVLYYNCELSGSCKVVGIK